MTFHSSDTQPDFYSSVVTRIKILPPEWKLGGRGIFFMGSCFADYLYSEYKSAGLNAMEAPFGNIYNPEALAAAVEMIKQGAASVTPEDCFNIGTDDDPHYRHFMFHSLKTADSADALTGTLGAGLSAARDYLRKSEALVVTLGTAWVFNRKNGRVVNNCHKLPAAEFSRSLLSVEEASASMRRMISTLKELNPKLKIILSLSPVRHLRDNAAENSLSKAVLRCAIDEACRGTGNIWYFPSYEIMLDELRDYRWYADDLCHPSAKAVSYIISRFIDSIYSSEFHDFLKEYNPVLRDLHHKPFNPESEEYISFKKGALLRLERLRAEYSGILVEEPVSLQ